MGNWYFLTVESGNEKTRPNFLYLEIWNSLHYSYLASKYNSLFASPRDLYGKFDFFVSASDFHLACKFLYCWKSLDFAFLKRFEVDDNKLASAILMKWLIILNVLNSEGVCESCVCLCVFGGTWDVMKSLWNHPWVGIFHHNIHFLYLFSFTHVAYSRIPPSWSLFSFPYLPPAPEPPRASL